MQNFGHLETYNTNRKVVVDDVKGNFLWHHFTVFFIQIVFTSFAVVVLIGDGNTPAVQHCFGGSLNFLEVKMYKIEFFSPFLDFLIDFGQ